MRVLRVFFPRARLARIDDNLAINVIQIRGIASGKSHVMRQGNRRNLRILHADEPSHAGAIGDESTPSTKASTVATATTEVSGRVRLGTN